MPIKNTKTMSISDNNIIQEILWKNIFLCLLKCHIYQLLMSIKVILSCTRIQFTYRNKKNTSSRSLT